MTRDRAGWSQQPRWRRALRWIGRRVLRLLARVEVVGSELVPADGPCLFAVNHNSVLDGLLGGLLLPGPCAVLVAEEWQRRWWVRAAMATFTPLIPVTRSGGGWRAALVALGVLEQGRAVGITPEGRVGRDGLLRGYPGVVWLASASGAPVVPTVFVIHGPAPALWRRPRRPLLWVRFGEPIACARAGSRQEQADRVMRAIAVLLPPEKRGVYGRVPPEEGS